MRAVRYAGGKAGPVALPAWVSVTAVCFPHRAEVVCKRCGRVVKLDGVKAEDERELGRFVRWHRGCLDLAEVKRRGLAPAAKPSDEWMRAFERRSEEGEGDGT